MDDVYGGLDAAAKAGIGPTDVSAAATLDDAGKSETLRDVCALMSSEAKRQTVDYARRSAGLSGIDWTCEKATGLLLRRARVTGTLKQSTKAEVVGVNADGDRATATVRFGGKKGQLTTIPLVREGGEWKLGATPDGG